MTQVDKFLTCHNAFFSVSIYDAKISTFYVIIYKSIFNIMWLKWACIDLT